MYSDFFVMEHKSPKEVFKKVDAINITNKPNKQIKHSQAENLRAKLFNKLQQRKKKKKINPTMVDSQIVIGRNMF